MKKFSIGTVLIGIVLTLGFLVIPTRIGSTGENLHVMDISVGPHAAKPLHPKIDGALARDIQNALYGGPQIPYPLLRRSSENPAGDEISVVIETQLFQTAIGFHPEVKILRGMVESFGGEIEAEAGNLIKTRLSPQAILTLANNDLVRLIRRPLQPTPDEYVSEGVHAIGADLWHNLTTYRMTPRNVKIAILDAGFKGYTGLLGSDLPTSVAARSFRTDGDIFADQVHGTACAEIVHDMAPNASLYLVNSSNEVTFGNAVDYLVGQNVDIISYSMGWFNAGAGNGTGPICETVSRATNQGILWANSAGNYAEAHWEGTFSDSDNDRFLNFSGIDEIIDFYVPSYTAVSVFLNWDDWGIWNGSSYSGSNQDYDLALWYWTGSNWIFVDASVGWQDGSQWPVEAIGGWYSTVGTYWGVSIYKYRSTRNCKHELFVLGNSQPVEYHVDAGSISIPSDLPAAMATGAISWSDDSYHYYSSRGPTHDGRTKPDYCAPSGVSTSSYGTRSFFGTSASAPHLAGALGLILTKTNYTATQAVYIIDARILDLGTAGKDNVFGLGRIKLSK